LQRILQQPFYISGEVVEEDKARRELSNQFKRYKNQVQLFAPNTSDAKLKEIMEEHALLFA
jgi:hypothetical protein